jgi:hypothetical protein
MNDFEFLLLLLAVFYVWECLYWIRRPGVAFRSWFGAGWSWRLLTGGLSNRFGGFLLSMPLPSFGGFFPVNWPTFAVSENALIKHPDLLDLYDEGPTKSNGRIAFDEMENVRSSRHHILINGRKMLEAGSPALANLLVGRIKKLKAAKPAERPAMEAQWPKESLDIAPIRDGVKSLGDAGRFLGFLSLMLLAHVAVVVPWSGLKFSLSSTWPMLVGVLLFVNTAIAIRFCRLHRRFYPAASDERFQHTFMMSLYPLASIRATETLARPFLEGFHPLAVAKVLLTDDVFKRVAAQHLRRLSVRIKSTTDPGERECFSRLETAMRTFLSEQKTDVKALMAPPEPGDPACRSFCPRCGSQFTFEKGTCSDCGTVAVESLKKK